MSHNCFISFKKEDAYYKDKIKDNIGYDSMIES